MIVQPTGSAPTSGSPSRRSRPPALPMTDSGTIGAHAHEAGDILVMLTMGPIRLLPSTFAPLGYY